MTYISSLVNEISDILNGAGEKTFGVYGEYDLHPYDSDSTWQEYKNIGVLYTSYGDINLLPNNQGLTGSFQLDLLLQVKDGDNLEHAVSAPLQYLIEHANGILHDESTATATVNYVMTYGLPTTDGQIQTTLSGIRYVVYSLPVRVTFSYGLVLGESATVKIKLPTGTGGAEQYETIKNIVTFTPTYNTTLDSGTQINSNTTKSSVLSATFNAQIVINYDKSDAAHNALIDIIEDEPQKVITIKYSFTGDVTAEREKDVILHDCALPMQRGQFDTIILNMSLAADV